MHLTKRNVSNAFFLSSSNSPVTLEPDCSPLSRACKRFGCSTGDSASPLPKSVPLTEGLTQAIIHQVPAAVAQVSMAAAIHRQQGDGKVRDFFETQAAPKQEFSDRALHTDSELQTRLFTKKTAGTILVLGGHELCLSSKPKWHSKFQNIEGIQITSFTSDKIVVIQSLALNSACSHKILAWQTLTMELVPPRTGAVDLKRWVHSTEVIKCSSALSLVNFSTDKKPKPHKLPPRQIYPKEP